MNPKTKNRRNENNILSRRGFLGDTTAAAALSLVPHYVLGEVGSASAGEKLQMADSHDVSQTDKDRISLTLKNKDKADIPTSDIVYVNPKTTEASLPEYWGCQKEDMVPDTLDLAEMARLAVNGLTEPTDPKADYEVFWRAHFWNQPPMMIHAFPDNGITKKLHIALPLMRLMSGSDQNLHVEKRWTQRLSWEHASDGFLYTPQIGRPWGTFETNAEDAGLEAQKGKYDHVVEPQVNGFALVIAAEYAQLMDSKPWERMARRIVDAYQRITVEKGDEAYLLRTWFPCNQSINKNTPPPKGLTASFAGWSALGMNLCYKQFGYKPAAKLAGKLLRYIIRSSGYFAADAGFNLDMPDVSADHPRYNVIHFHGHSLVILHALHHALLTGDQELLDFARRGYQKAISYGQNDLGWFPERVSGYPEPQAAELCCIADMIMAAVFFAQAQLEDSCWDDSDRWLRNHFAEAQLRHGDWIYRFSTGMNPIAATGRWQWACFDRVPERNIGSFSGWCDVNDFTLFHKDRQHMRGLMHCCTGNADRALYLAWRYMIHHDGTNLKVHLLLNRASPWADIHSHIPYAGQVDVHVHQPVKLSLRIPNWITLSQVRLTVNGNDQPTSYEGRYLQAGSLQPGDQVSLFFPLAEENVDKVIFIEKRRYAIRRKGNTVVVMDPPGRYFPLYQRNHYRQNQTRWHRVQRFYSEKEITWL